MPQNPLQYVPAIKTVGSANVSAPLKVDAQNNILIGKGNTATYNLSASTVIKATPGRVCKVSVITAGSAPGTINNCITTGAAAASNEIFVVPNTAGMYDIDWPCSTGITYILGTGQVVAISFT
jgi:hypothetical protein